MHKEDEDREQELSNIRANFARLETRARQLLRHSDFRVLRTPRSVYQATKSCLEEFSKQPTSSTVTDQQRGEPVELFLSNLGFSIQEHAQHLQLLAAKRETEMVFSKSEAAGPAMSSDLDEFLSDRRNTLLRRVSESAQNQIAAKIASFGVQHQRFVHRQRTKEFEEACEQKAMSNSEDSGISRGLYRPSDSSVLNGLFGNTDTFSPTDKAKMEGFARAVTRYSPKEWLGLFLEVAQQASATDAPNAAASCELWAQVKRILDPTAIADSAELSFVSASRAELERSFLLDVIDTCSVRVTSQNISDLLKSDATGYIKKYLERNFPPKDGDGGKWRCIFFAMRAGRYDVAQHVASTSGFRQVAAALSTVAATHVAKRCQLLPASELEDFKIFCAEQATKEDPFRCAVLLILLGGSVGDARVLRTIVENIMTSIEDILWFRLALVRRIEKPTAAGGLINCLQDLQLQVKNDQAQLSMTVGGSGSRHSAELYKLAALFFQVLLPAGAVRILTHSAATYVDGVHLALAVRTLGFDNSTLSDEKKIETPLDFPRLLNRYCRVLLENNTASCWLTETIFAYFFKLTPPEAFLAFCSDDVVCVKLFGHPGGPTSALSGTANVDLLSALEAVAGECSARGSVELAVHILLVSEEAYRQAAPDRAAEVLLLAVQVMNSVLSNIAHQTPFVPSESIISTARRLGDQIRKQKGIIAPSVVGSFDTLTKIVEFSTHAVNRQADLAIAAFYSLSFAPRITAANADAEVTRASEEFNLGVGEEVQTAVPSAVKVLGQLLLTEFQQATSQQNKKRFQDMFRLLLKWVCRWRSQLSRDAPSYLSSLATQLA
jgi:hypothetical protein